MFKLDNYNQAGFTSSNSVRFVRVDDSPSQRKDLTVSRKPSVYQSGQDAFSIPEYRMVVRKDAVTDGKPNGQRLTFDLVVRTPLGTEGDLFDEALTELESVITDPEFKDAVLRQLFPVECPCVDE